MKNLEKTNPLILFQLVIHQQIILVINMDHTQKRFMIHISNLTKKLVKLLTYLNYNIGKENVVIFLTADHGASSEPHKLLDFNIPGGYFHKNEVVDKLTTHLKKIF